MALVQYEISSDESDEEETRLQCPIKTDVTTQLESNQVNTLHIQTENTFAPKMQSAGQSREDPDDKPPKLTKMTPTHSNLTPFVTAVGKGKNAKVKITFPDLPPVLTAEVDLPADAGFKRPSLDMAATSGLFGMLPAPKMTPITNTSFVPRSVTAKPPEKKPATATVPVQKAANRAPKRPADTTSAGPSDADLVPVKSDDSSSEEEEEDEDPKLFNDEMWQKVCGRRTKRVPRRAMNDTTPDGYDEDWDEPIATVNAAPALEEPNLGLDNEAFKSLVGANRRIPTNMRMVDINEADVLPDRDIWMRKALTEPEHEARPTEDDELNPISRKKHHIMYLAQQARAKEQELKSQWATSRQNRQQSQAKYGF